MVDNIHPRQKKIFGFNVLDEPILRRVFDEGTGVTVNLEGVELLVPPPVILLATKLRSIPLRTKDDKLVKDACDIYSILWHSSEGYKKILTNIHREYPEDCIAGFNAITDKILKKAAHHPGIDVERYRDVIQPLNAI